MVKRTAKWVVIVALLLGSFGAIAKQRDPLTQDEIDQLREVSGIGESKYQALASKVRV